MANDQNGAGNGKSVPSLKSDIHLRGRDVQPGEDGAAPAWDSEALGHLNPNDPSGLPAIRQGLTVAGDHGVPPALLKHRLLGPDEEAALLRAYLVDGDRAALRRLVLCNQKLIFRIANGVYKARGRAVPLGELFQAGQEGLIEAIRRFDLDSGYRLSTYASYWIYQAAGRTSDNDGHTIRIPVHKQEKKRQIDRKAAKLAQRLRRPPTMAELAKETGYTEEWLQNLFWSVDGIGQTISLDRESRGGHDPEDGDGGQLYTILGIEDGNATAPAPEAEVERTEAERIIEGVLLEIDPRAARILQLRNGLVNGRAMTLKEVGAKFGLTRERVRQIERDALALLRNRYGARLRELL